MKPRLRRVIPSKREQLRYGSNHPLKGEGLNGTEPCVTREHRSLLRFAPVSA